MQVKCLNVNYFNNGTTNFPTMPYTTPGDVSGSVGSPATFSASVTFADEGNTANTFQITFTSLTEYLPYLPGKTYNLNITEVGSAD